MKLINFINKHCLIELIEVGMSSSFQQSRQCLEVGEQLRGKYLRIFQNRQNTPLKNISQNKIHQFLQTLIAFDLLKQLNQSECQEILYQLEKSAKEYIQLNGYNVFSYQEAIRMLEYCLQKEGRSIKPSKDTSQINQLEQVQKGKEEEAEKWNVCKNQLFTQDYQFSIEQGSKEMEEKNKRKTEDHKEKATKQRANRAQFRSCIQKNQIQFQTQQIVKNKSLKEVFNQTISTYQFLLRQHTKPKQIQILTKTIKQLRKNKQQLKEINDVNSKIDHQIHKIQNRIRFLFNFYCKKHQLIGKGATFDSIKQQSKKMDIGSMIMFCNGNGIFSRRINRNLVVDKFKKVGENNKLISFDQFSILLRQLANSQYQENQNSMEYFYNKLKLIKDEDYREKLKQLNIPIYYEKGSFRKYREKSQSIKAPTQAKKKKKKPLQYKKNMQKKKKQDQTSRMSQNDSVIQLTRLNINKCKSTSKQHIKNIVYNFKNNKNNYNSVGNSQKIPEIDSFSNTMVFNDDKDYIKFLDSNEKKDQKHIKTELCKRSNQQIFKQAIKQQTFLKKLKHK